MRDEHLQELDGLLTRARCEGVAAADFRRYGSARSLYHFKTDNIGFY